MQKRRIGPGIINFFKNLMCPSNTLGNKNNHSDNSFVSIRYTIPESNPNILKIVKSKIEKSNRKKIKHFQHRAYHHFSKKNEIDHECCVCYCDDFDYTPIKCGHTICVFCYDAMLERKMEQCPYCKQKMVLFDPNSNFAILMHIGNFTHEMDGIEQNYHNCVAIYYTPEIPTGEDGKCLSYDFFCDLDCDEKERTRLVNAISHLHTNGYKLVLEKTYVIKTFLQKNGLQNLNKYPMYDLDTM